MAGIVRADTFRMNTIKSQDSDVTAMTIDGVGRISLPTHVMFQCYLRGAPNGAYTTGTPSTLTATSSGLSFSSSTEWVCVDTHVNNGNHYSTSTGRFTAPVNGTYKFWWRFLGDYSQNSVSEIHTELRKNGANDSMLGSESYSEMASSAPNRYNDVSGEILFTLDANDYVSIWLTGGFHQRYSGWGGELIG